MSILRLYSIKDAFFSAADVFTKIKRTKDFTASYPLSFDFKNRNFALFKTAQRIAFAVKNVENS